MNKKCARKIGKLFWKQSGIQKIAREKIWIFSCLIRKKYVIESKVKRVHFFVFNIMVVKALSKTKRGTETFQETKNKIVCYVRQVTNTFNNTGKIQRNRQN